jgi:hypothetical protein
MATFAAFYDANVLYPAELRNFLMHLAMTGLFRAKWSAEVHEEWIRNLLISRPELTRMQLERTRDLMDKHALDALVTGYEDLIPGVQLPDPGDRHVLAVAIRGRADVTEHRQGRHAVPLQPILFVRTVTAGDAAGYGCAERRGEDGTRPGNHSGCLLDGIL